MAEIVLKIGDGKHYQDGDVLCAFSNQQISHVHLQHLCQINREGVNAEGQPVDRDLQELYLTKNRRFRFDRLSDREITQTNLLTGEILVGGKDSPTADMRMDVPLYIARRYRNDPNLLFGPKGKEYWFSGDVTPDPIVLEELWDAVEDHLEVSRTQPEFTLWPLGYQDIRSHLVIRTVDFTEAEASYLVSPELELDDNGEVVSDDDGHPRVRSKRNIKIDWRELLSDLGVNESDVLDPHIPVGSDVVIRGKLKHHSKDQKQQEDRQKLHNKTQGRLP